MILPYDPEVIRERVGDLDIASGYNLGYLLQHMSYRTLVPYLMDVCDRGVEPSSDLSEVHTLDLGNAVYGYPNPYTPKSTEEASAFRDEFAFRAANKPLNAEVDVEVHTLLDGIRRGTKYIEYYSRQTEVVVVE